MSEPKDTAEPSGASGGSLAWIPVEERVPMIYETVIASTGREVGIAYRYVDGWYWDVVGHAPCAPTHWMPLPDPPTDAK